MNKDLYDFFNKNCSETITIQILKNFQIRYQNINNKTKVKVLKRGIKTYFFWETGIEYHKRILEWLIEKRKNKIITGNYRHSILLPIFSPYQKTKVIYKKEVPEPQRKCRVVKLEKINISFLKRDVIFSFFYDIKTDTVLISDNVKIKEKETNKTNLWKKSENIFCDIITGE